MTAEELRIATAMKAELRKRMRALRKTATIEACRERSTKICIEVTRQLEERKAQHVALFAAIESRNEVDLRAVDEALRRRNAHVYYPSIAESGEMTFRKARLESLEERGYGFREPAPSDNAAEHLDAIIVPALAVDARGYRLGYGAGYYDRTLPRYAPPAATIIVAYDYQFLIELPAMPHDVPCHAVITDARALQVAL